MDATRIPERTLLQQPKSSIHKPCQTLHKEQEYKDATNTIDGKVREESRKVIVRSSYFQNKSRNENDEEDMQKKLMKDNLSSNTCKNSFAGSAALGDGYFNGKVIKRKDPSNNSLQTVGYIPFVLFLQFQLLFSTFIKKKNFSALVFKK